MSVETPRLARPDLRNFTPYGSAFRQAAWTDGIRLDANENPYGSLVEGEAFKELNRYPEPQPLALIQRMAALYGVEPENILVSRGADEAIDLLTRGFCEPVKDAIAIFPPTFGYYETAARLHGAGVVAVNLDHPFQFNLARALSAIKAAGSVKLIYLCTPMNPTGGVIERNEILNLCETASNSLVVVDEAYLEFSDQRSLVRDATSRENLVVLRTLSKAYGLAGSRCGAAIAEIATIEFLRRLVAPYPLPSPAIHAALSTLSPSRLPIIEKRIETIKTERARILDCLRRAPRVSEVFPSQANFIYFEARDIDLLAQKLRARGVRLRFRPDASPNGVRFSIGTREQNDLALAALGADLTPARRRLGEFVRDTNETRIAVSIDLDDAGDIRVDTGIAFYDHMLAQAAKHGGFSLQLACEGDLEVDPHHTIEDCALAFGSAFRKALGDLRGVARFGFALPMDEAGAQILIDFSGRPLCVYSGEFTATHIGAYPTEMTGHVFRSFADSLRATIHLSVSGENDHHKTEACFKAFGRALRQAIARKGDELPSTKGVLA